MGAINVAAVAKHHDARIIYFQTVLPPISSYAISKIAGEHYLRLSGQPLTVFRLASVYGPRNLSGPIPTFYRRIKAGERCQVVRDVTRDFVFIEDLLARVLGTPDGSGVIDVRSGTETPIEYLPLADRGHARSGARHRASRQTCRRRAGVRHERLPAPGHAAGGRSCAHRGVVREARRRRNAHPPHTEGMTMLDTRKLSYLLSDAVTASYEPGSSTGVLLSGGIDSSTVACLAPELPVFTG